MSEPLAGRTAIVTGASRGIGLAAAAALHDAGANVVLTARTEEAARAAADSVGPRALGIGAHATDEDLARACVERTMEAFGSVDVLVNNAGTNPAYGPVLAQDHGRFAKTLDVNLWAPILWSRLVVDAWMGEHGGSIINIVSIGGMRVGPFLGAYNISKAALLHMTRQLALELAPKVRVNAIAPGLVKTQFAKALWQTNEEAVAARTPLRRLGEPDDIAPAALFLASDAGAWVTGEVMVVDGGASLL